LSFSTKDLNSQIHRNLLVVTDTTLGEKRMSRDYDKVLELIRLQLLETRRQSAELRDIARAARTAAVNARNQAQMVRKLAKLVSEEAAHAPNLPTAPAPDMVVLAKSKAKKRIKSK
jgi:hypothetical protein